MYYTTLYGMLDQAVFGDFSQPDMTWQFLFDEYEEYDHVFAWPQERRLCTSYTEETSDGKAREVLSLYDMDSGRKVACWPVDIEDDEAVTQSGRSLQTIGRIQVRLSFILAAGPMKFMYGIL